VHYIKNNLIKSYNICSQAQLQHFHLLSGHFSTMERFLSAFVSSTSTAQWSVHVYSLC